MNADRPYFIGLMSGTSLDALDAALVDFSGQRPKLTATLSTEWPASLKSQLLALCSPGDNEIQRMGKADHELGNLCAQACQQLLSKAGISANQVAAIGSHGQTIRHMPEGETPFTVQIGDPNLIAQLTGITTVADFRRRDMAAGGQGAPLAPGFHAAIFRTNDKNRAILNIGGMANLTLLFADSCQPVTGFDTGPGNILLDGWCQQHLNKAYDQNGQWARSGTVNSALLEQLLATPYFVSPPPKSTGRELFNSQWLDQQLKASHSKISTEDVAATLTELTAQSICNDLQGYFPSCDELLVCGGGAHNQLLMERINVLTPETINVDTTSSLGIKPDWVEAAAFACFAKQTLEHKPSNLRSVTGANSVCILGGVYYA
jgi:anhydro-N-acetylmuramic acid kinase